MKRKVLAIILSLALLTSLFVLASPVVAKNDTNDKFFEVEFSIERTGYPTEGQNRVWFGSPAILTLPEGSLGGALETRTIPQGRIMKWWPWLSYGDITGDFGPLGVLSGTFTAETWGSYNYTVGEIRAHKTISCVFAEGTMVLKIRCKGTMAYWRDIDPASHRLYRQRGTCTSYVTLVSGTGIFEGLKFTSVGYSEYDVPIHHYEGIGHFAP
jgi:hypothetical protein